MLLLSPKNFNDYELIDVGNFEKLERFGQYITIRPEPQAVWEPKLNAQQWREKAHVKFVAKSSSSGNWDKLKNIPDRWNIEYQVNSPQSTVHSLKFRLALTSFKHVGIFPEQAVNWDYITESIKSLTPSPLPTGRQGSPSGEGGVKFLNLFAYTGAASIAAKAAGADVTHVDSIKQVVTWANENMQHSSLDNIRWVVEDAMKFVKREVKRGKKYHGIILDPPAYGHGPNGESWKLEEMIDEMLKNVLQLLDEEKHFLILNTYSLGFSSLIIENLIYNNLSYKPALETGELYLQATTGHKLPLGVFGRFRKI